MRRGRRGGRVGRWCRASKACRKKLCATRESAGQNVLLVLWRPATGLWEALLLFKSGWDGLDALAVLDGSRPIALECWGLSCSEVQQREEL
jgi:hypothetical protein